MTSKPKLRKALPGTIIKDQTWKTIIFNTNNSSLVLSTLFNVESETCEIEDLCVLTPSSDESADSFIQALIKPWQDRIKRRNQPEILAIVASINEIRREWRDNDNVGAESVRQVLDLIVNKFIPEAIKVAK